MIRCGRWRRQSDRTERREGGRKEGRREGQRKQGTAERERDEDFGELRGTKSDETESLLSLWKERGHTYKRKLNVPFTSYLIFFFFGERGRITGVASQRLMMPSLSTFSWFSS